MYPILRHDLDQLEDILRKTCAEGLSFLRKLDQLPTSSPSPRWEPGNMRLNEEGLGAEAALHDFLQRFADAIVASSRPRYWGFVTGGATPAAIAGDWLAAVYDQNTQAASGHGDVSGRIELETIRLLLQFFGLPEDFFGGFVSGATMSNFSCLAVARQWLGRQAAAGTSAAGADGRDIALEGLSGPLPVLAGTPHSSSLKSLAMLGMGSGQLIRVGSLPGNREAMDTGSLEKAIETLRGHPFILISSAGTVNTVDYDDLEAIAQLKARYSFWWHIDAAFGAFAALSPEQAHLLKGWEAADSITVDAHKWLNVPYENAFFLVKEKHQALQFETFRNSQAPYLGQADAFSYLNFLPENSRRLKALPVLLTLLAYGREGYRQIVENNIRLAKELGARLTGSADFELLAPVRLNTVCFALKAAGQQGATGYTKAAEDSHDSDLTPLFLEKLNQRGKVFMTPTVYAGRKGIRAALVNWRSTLADLDLVIAEMEAVIREMKHKAG